MGDDEHSKERKQERKEERAPTLYLSLLQHNNIHEGTGIFLQGT